MQDATRKCRCGNRIPKYHSKFCSSECRERSYYTPRIPTGTFTCAAPACHNLCASSQSAAMFCSNPCKLVGKKIRRSGPHATRVHPHWVLSQPVHGPTLDYLVSLPMFGPTIDDWPMFGPTTPLRPDSAECKTCERTYRRSDRGGRSYCSERCQNVALGRASIEAPIGYATCPDTGCGSLYVFDARKNRPAGCCPQHTTRITRRRRKRAARALKRDQRHEPYTLREIADRDGWRCHLCGKKVPDRQYGAKDRDPTIDHLVPQSAGGDDIKSNVALAHNRCNWERSNLGVAQLRLIA